ncbi:hypothetical protein ACWD25_39310 [Streptomyces sp. NPDC002920]
MRFSWLRRKHVFTCLSVVAAVLTGSAGLAVQTAPTASAAACAW